MIAQTLTHYRITAKLGEGGMGAVYRAADTKLGRGVAIKVLPQEVSRDPQALARFEREARSLATLNHPNIASIYGFEVDKDVHFIVLELVEGETLAERLRKGRLSLDESLQVARQIAEAVEAAHAKGIVHRDLKPGNIKFTADGRVKVLDFGLAKLTASATSGEEVTIKSDQTAAGTLLGTPAYMSPEQARGHEVDKRTDVWAFGCCLFECLAGLKPFRGNTVSDLMADVLRSEPDWSVLPAETPREVTTLLHRCLEKDPRRRLSSLGDIAITLEDSTISKPAITHSGVTPKTMRRPKIAVWAVAGGLTALLALAGFWWLRGTSASNSLRYQKSVAVLPLELKNPGMEPFADSLGEGLANALGALRKFDRVPPWEASSGIDRRRQDIRAIAQRLEVSTLLMGSIRKEGDGLQIAMSLVNPFHGKGGNVIWSESFRHNQGNELPFEIQDQISRSVVENLQVQLDNQAQSKFVNHFTRSAEAYECYSKGRYHWKRRGPDLEKAKHWFELALLYDSPTGVIEDSRMAVAWVGLADAYNLQRFYGQVSASEGLAKGRAYVAKALEIDPDVAEAHAALGWLRLVDRDGPGAAAAFERAIQLNDRCVSAYHWYASYFGAIGNKMRTIEMARKAIEVDPVSDFTKAISAWQMLFAVEAQESLKILDSVLQNNPTLALAHYLKGLALLLLYEPAAAVPNFETASKLSGQQTFFESGLAYGLARAGKRQEALGAIERCKNAVRIGHPALNLAGAYLALGDKERCFEVLERDLAEGGGSPWLISTANFKSIEAEPRFIGLVNRTGLLKYNPTTKQFEPNTEPR